MPMTAVAMVSPLGRRVVIAAAASVVRSAKLSRAAAIVAALLRWRPAAAAVLLAAVLSVGLAHEFLFDFVLELLQESLFLVGRLVAVGEEAAFAVHSCWGGGEGEDCVVILVCG